MFCCVCGPINCPYQWTCRLLPIFACTRSFLMTSFGTFGIYLYRINTWGGFVCQRIYASVILINITKIWNGINLLFLQKCMRMHTSFNHQQYYVISKLLLVFLLMFVYTIILIFICFTFVLLYLYLIFYSLKGQIK